MLKLWVLLGILLAAATAQIQHHPQYLSQDTYKETDEPSYHSFQNEYTRPRRYESLYNEPSRYQSIEPQYPESDRYPSHTSYFVVPQTHETNGPSYQLPYDQPEPEVHSYDKSEDVSNQRGFHPLDKSQEVPNFDSSQESSKPQLLSYNSLKDIAYQKAGASDEPDDYSPPSQDVPGPKYAPVPEKPASPHPAPVPVDPKLPLYFTMYEKRIIADPANKYGKGPWRFLTYGHGITYGSKEPGKVFEKGYGYIRALGRDVCKLPEHLCPPKDGKPFEYEGRKEPYFGYRPH